MAESQSGAAGSVDVATLHVGDWVRVKDRDGLLATLDTEGRVDGLPLMPEMLAFAGRLMRVDAVVHRTCDTVKSSGSSGTTRGMKGVVHLEAARCDGSEHGGCQARCLLYWKQEWLEPASPDDLAPSAIRKDGIGDVPEMLAKGSRGNGHTEANPVYACQATDLLKASQFVSARDPRIWMKDVRSRNASLRVAAASLGVLLVNKWQNLSDRLPSPLRTNSGRSRSSSTSNGKKRTFPSLDLQPGDLVEVKSLSEIEATLDENGALRGLRFSAEMIPYCGKKVRVLDRVERIIDERTGRMISLRDCILLEDVWCQGTYRALCRRKIYAYWREAWLRRVEPGLTET